ncbi:hypothetical protein [Hoeflea sp. TYP-13]|uniref:hypothetical protein n=1 Tax=Hoeflea sp. TYP-13 TaxID=3230023 RepID=UPI0034C633DE
MSTQNYRPSDQELADWSKRRDALASQLENFTYPPDDGWLRELVVRHTEPMAEACKGLSKDVPLNVRLSEAAMETDRHLKEKIVNTGQRAEADVEYLHASLKRCVAAMDEWVKTHSKS